MELASSKGVSFLVCHLPSPPLPAPLVRHHHRHSIYCDHSFPWIRISNNSMNSYTTTTTRRVGETGSFSDSQSEQRQWNNSSVLLIGVPGGALCRLVTEQIKRRDDACGRGNKWVGMWLYNCRWGGRVRDWWMDSRVFLVFSNREQLAISNFTDRNTT